jgi:hypothetical protein
MRRQQILFSQPMALGKAVGFDQGVNLRNLFAFEFGQRGVNFELA